MDRFQLKTGNFGHYASFLSNVPDFVRKCGADISAYHNLRECRLHHLADQRRGCCFSIGACHRNHRRPAQNTGQFNLAPYRNTSGVRRLYQRVINGYSRRKDQQFLPLQQRFILPSHGQGDFSCHAFQPCGCFHLLLLFPIRQSNKGALFLQHLRRRNATYASAKNQHFFSSQFHHISLPPVDPITIQRPTRPDTIPANQNTCTTRVSDQPPSSK